LVGGVLADYFSVRNIAFDFTWTDPAQTINLGVINLTSFDFLFIIAFIMGLITLSLLASVSEEGEVSREVVLDELTSQTRTFSRAVSSVPGLGYITMFPFAYLRRIPGVDVATSATAYQLADITKTAVKATTRGRTATARIIGAIEDTISRVGKTKEEMKLRGAEVARHTARGAIHATEGTTTDMQRVIPPTLIGVVRSLKRADVNPSEALKGASYGIIQGSDEIGADLAKTVSQTVAGAKEVAKEIGLDEETVIAKAREGILEAAEAVSPGAATQVREVLSAEL
jgi:hypothetical protein